MTLLDAPVFDPTRERRNQTFLYGGAVLLVLLLIGGWFVSGRPIDWPWNWWTHLRARMTANHFLATVEQNDLPKAYGIWFHDPKWQQHANKYDAYPFDRFQKDWGSTSSANEYGAIKSHKILAERIAGNVVVLGIRINDLKSNNLFLDYDPHMHTLGFSPVELYLGP
jgi:hypothetical protein